MIGMKNIGADLITPTGSEMHPAQTHFFLVLFFFLVLIFLNNCQKFCLQNFQGNFAITALVAFFLRSHDNSGWFVSQPDGTTDLIYVLSAMSPTSEKIPDDVNFSNIDFIY